MLEKHRQVLGSLFPRREINPVSAIRSGRMAGVAVGDIGH
jgi:hypothetical protein